jgi:hypothetical protein
MSTSLLDAMKEAEHRVVGGVQIDVVRAGAARIKRVVYPPGFQWSTHMKPIVGTDMCEHAHVGFLAQGRIHVMYADGCAVELVAPQALAIAPGHDGRVVGDEPAIVIEVDFERETIERLGMPKTHRHTEAAV